jgi:CBS domain-containing protein
MRDNDIGSLPVLDDGDPIGMITDRDIAIRVVAEGKDPNTTRVAEIFSGDLVAVAPGRTLEEAEQLMAEYKVRRLAVVTEGRLVGILAQADIALEESPEKAGKLLEAVSEPSSTPRE